MTFAQRADASETRIFRVVFPNTTNHYDTLFGGTALGYMDEVAFITATRFTRKRVVTVASGRVDFRHPIPADSIIEVVLPAVDDGEKRVRPGPAAAEVASVEVEEGQAVEKGAVLVRFREG